MDAPENSQTDLLPKPRMTIAEFARFIGRDRKTVGRWVALHIATAGTEVLSPLPRPATGVFVDPQTGRRWITTT